MPKIIELTVEIVVQKVSCPGVWLCQDGSVSLIVFALGTSYETCMLPPTFPLVFNDKLYFRKRFKETCALSNICCLLKEESLYCELVQWCQDCASNESKILAQYLGSLNDVLFPPKTCCSDGVDLLMRRSKIYPGILSPKIEIATKVRIDEVWNDKCKPYVNPKIRTCHCTAYTESRQKAVCHSTEYHRKKCSTGTMLKTGSRSRSRSGGSESCSSLKEQMPQMFRCAQSDPVCKSAPHSPRTRRPCRRNYCVYNMELPKDQNWNSASGNSSHDNDDDSGRDKDLDPYNEDKKVLIESRYVDDEGLEKCKDIPSSNKKYGQHEIKPCVCEICRRYHELFHPNNS